MEGARAYDMSIFSELRSLAFLRRIAKAQERLAAVAEARLEHDRQEWRNKTPRHTEFGTLDLHEVNERWRKEQEAAEYGGVVED